MNIFKTRNDVITYTVNKDTNPNLYISIQNGEVVINAPWYTTSNQIQRMVQEKREWILEKLQEYEQNCEAKRVQKSTVKLLGEQYEMAISYRAIKVPSLDIEDRKIKITLPNKYKKMEIEQITSILLERMYLLVAQREIENAMEKARVNMGMAPDDFEIKKMEKTLAKCINNKITINPEVAKYSKKAIEYIVIHEFCHLRYKNHTKSFYSMIETYMPEYELYVKELSNFQY